MTAGALQGRTHCAPCVGAERCPAPSPHQPASSTRLRAPSPPLCRCTGGRSPSPPSCGHVGHWASPPLPELCPGRGLLPSRTGERRCPGQPAVPEGPLCPQPDPCWEGTPRHTPLTTPCPLPADNAETRAATMPDSPADVKTQSRSTPPSMPPPPPAVTQGATRHPSFTPNTSEYRAAGGDGDGMPGRGAARLPSPPGHTPHPGPAASSDPCAVLATPWGGIAHPCTGEGVWAARPKPQVVHVPAGSTTAPPNAGVLGDRDVLVSCRVATEWWHRAARGPGRSRLQVEDAAGWGSPRGSELASLGVPGTWGPACLSARGTAVAGERHGQPWWQGCPCPAQATAWWHRGDLAGTRGPSPQSL